MNVGSREVENKIGRMVWINALRNFVAVDFSLVTGGSLGDESRQILLQGFNICR